MDQLFYGNYFPCNFMQYLIYQTEFHENSDFFQILCKYMEKLYGIPWEKKTSIKFYGIPWKKKKISMDFHGIPCPKPRQNSTEFHGKFSIELHGISMELHGIPWNSMSQTQTEFHGVPWKIFHGTPWNSMEFHGVILHGISGGCLIGKDFR